MWPKREECYSLYARNLKSKSKVSAKTESLKMMEKVWGGGGDLLSLIASDGP